MPRRVFGWRKWEWIEKGHQKFGSNGYGRLGRLGRLGSDVQSVYVLLVIHRTCRPVWAPQPWWKAHWYRLDESGSLRNSIPGLAGRGLRGLAMGNRHGHIWQMMGKNHGKNHGKKPSSWGNKQVRQILKDHNAGGLQKSIKVLEESANSCDWSH